jgi:hypothetical protein
VKGLVEAMGGSTLARPSELGGLEVIVRLPVEREAEPEAEPAPEPATEPAVEPEGEPAVESAVEPAVEPADETETAATSNPALPL